MSSSDVFVGLDLSKSVLRICVLPQSRIWEWSNDKRGLTELVKSLVALCPSLVTMEGKGKTRHRVRSRLEEAGLSVSVVKPSQMRELVKSLGVLSNTHAIYAMVLARHGQLAATKARCEGEKQAGELDALLMRRCQLAEMLTTERVRLRTGPECVSGAIKAHISWLENCLKRIDKDTDGMIKTKPIWGQNRRVVNLVPGAGPIW